MILSLFLASLPQREETNILYSYNKHYNFFNQVLKRAKSIKDDIKEKKYSLAQKKVSLHLIDLWCLMSDWNKENIPKKDNYFIWLIKWMSVLKIDKFLEFVYVIYIYP